MDETSALAVTAVRAVETADRAGAAWTDDDRAWASRAAAEVVGADAPPADFVARRARLALERMATRGHPVARLAGAWRWRPWVGGALAVAAFVAGAASDWVGGTKRIDVLNPPVFALVVWNLATYAVLAAGFVVRYGEPGAPGPWRRAVAWFAGVARGAGHGGASTDPSVRAAATFARDWRARAGPVYAARAARVLHVAAAALAAGAVAGLYVRGLALEYRATWESTFLDAAQVRAIVAAFYWPGAWTAGVAVPDVAAVATIRAPAAGDAAPWLHLMAATLALVVIAPRAVLAAGAALVERHRAARIVNSLAEPYFARMLRGFHPGSAHVDVVPYSYAPPPPALVTLEALLARALGGGVALVVAPPLAYGDEDVPGVVPAGAEHVPVVALFNATATPEREAHGRFVAVLRAAHRPLVAVVDEATANARSHGDPARRDERRALWRDVLTEHAVVPVFVDLSAPDAEAVDAALDAALAGALP